VSSKGLIFRYPDGDTEFYWAPDAPAVGDTIGRRNGNWIVSRVEANFEGVVNVTVLPAEVVRDDAWPRPYEFITG
jgi:hypothetical protein